MLPHQFGAGTQGLSFQDDPAHGLQARLLQLLSDYGRHVLLPREKFATFTSPDPTIPKSIGHQQEWLLACKTDGPTTCNFDYSGTLTEAVLLGAASYKTGRKLEWDAQRLTATNCPEAGNFIHKEYRDGWSI
jgi:hypothetical protein